ncbi:DUF3199 family protein [Bacillus cereus]|uniref:DUF3199 family protein n=1 Tax=Bacillus cereus TaxID=1396 RepID=UPI0022EC95A3|nr:DUF3199 family protein [Bacillus cereus]MDA4083844.1 DUF3199 family protein [Bacillus cereus]
MYASPADVKEKTSFKEISSLSNEKIQLYIDRAAAWIHREVKRTFENEKKKQTLLDLLIATVLLVEYLWYQDHPEMKETQMSSLSNEEIGNYSYTLRDALDGNKTGIKELDLILDSLRVQNTVTGFNFFSVSGPSRAKR